MTKHYVLIGAPVTSVRTPPLLQAYLIDKGIDAKVWADHVEPNDLAAYIGEFAAGNAVDGLMVTMPHKKPVVAYMDVLSTMAKAAGSVNAIKRMADGKLVGAQFDGVGLVEALSAKGVDLAETRVLLAGVGGAGLAIAEAIGARGCASLTIMETNTPLRDNVVATLAAKASWPVAATSEPKAGAYDLLINATPLGMREGDPSPFPADLVGSAQFVADIVSDPLHTRLEALSLEAGVTFITGRDMVRGQVAPIGDWLLHSDIEQR